MSLLVPIVIAVVIVALGIVLLFSATWKVAEPNEALIISGSRARKTEEGKGFRIVTGHGTIVIPGIQKARRLDLGAHRVGVDEACVTTQGIDITISAVVIYKIGDDFPSIANAARRFLGQEDQMDNQVHDVFAGHLRSIVGSMTMEDLITNRQELASQTRDASSDELQKLGLIVDSLQIDKIGDPTGYIKNLGAPHVAQVQSKARIAEAEANQDAVKREQETAAMNAEAQRDSVVKQQAAQAAIEQAKARSAQAGPLADAEARQEVVQKETELAQLAAARKEKELESEVRKPADAEAYRNVTIAEAEKKATILKAQAAAEQTKLEGDARAQATQAVGAAEGAALAARRDALEHGGNAVIAQLLAENYPDIVRAASESLGKVGNMTILNGAEGVTGALGSLIGAGGAMWGPLSEIYKQSFISVDADKPATVIEEEPSAK